MPLMTANRAELRGKTVLNIGTGSGIAALHAAQLGARRVVATDFEPRALDCVRQNARRLGLESVLETRLATAADSSAYSAVLTGERYDIVLSFSSGTINRAPRLVSGDFDEGIGPHDNIELGLSLLEGLRRHLVPGGVAVLYCEYAPAHTLLVRYARHLGLDVAHHPAMRISAADWNALYSNFAVQVARSEGLGPLALLPQQPDGLPEGARLSPEFMKAALGEPGDAFPRLWNVDLDRVLPGMIVVRSRAAPSGEAAPGPLDEGAKSP